MANAVHRKFYLLLTVAHFSAMLVFITCRTIGFVFVAKINMTPFIGGFPVFSSLKSPAYLTLTVRAGVILTVILILL